jgi:hypothetical protein
MLWQKPFDHDPQLTRRNGLRIKARILERDSQSPARLEPIERGAFFEFL